MSFTPGPWKAGKNVVGADRTVVCQVNRPTGGDIRTENANAQLIASAPELLAAAEYCVDGLSDEYPQLTLKKRLRSAIAVAKGGAA